MRLIAAVAADWGIGYRGDLLFDLPGDKRHFKELTWNQTVVLGRATLDSLPGGRPLPGRTNLVLTRNRDFRRDGVTVLHSLDELPESGDFWVMGGAEVYAALLPRCTEAEITCVQATRPADRFLENLDENPDWTLESESEPVEENGLRYTFRRYRRMDN